MSDGLEDVVAADTVLSEVDGKAGRLIIRGRTLDELAGRTTFEDLVHLLFQGFFDDLPGPIDHVLVAAYTRRSYGPMLDSPSAETGQGIGRRVTQVLEIARNAAPKMRPGGTLLLTGGSERNLSREAGITPAAFAVLPPFTAALALELAPVRVNLIQAAFVDTALAESYFADEAALEARREELRATSPIGRVVEPTDVAALAVHLMTNTAVTGATYDVDGGQRLVA